MTDCEVAIVGGGPVGVLLACLLDAHDVDARVFEGGVARNGSRAIGIHPPGLAALDAAGVGDEVRAEALVVESGVATCRGRTLASLPLTGVRTLPQERTEHLLRERLGRRALELARPVRGVADEGERVVLDLGDRTIRAEFAVAADGVRSAVRRALGIEWRRCAGTGHFLMTDAPSPDGDPRALLHLEPQGVVESFPMPGGVRRWVARVPADETRPLADIVRARTGERIPPTPVSAFTAGQHRAGSLRRGRVFLVGDAAHEISPIGGQGMNLGWIGALRLARVLVSLLHDGHGDPDAFDRRMRPAVARAHRRARFNMSMGAPRSGAPLALRNAAVRWFGTPLLRNALTRTFTMSGL